MNSPGPNNILITGAAGFVGSYMLQEATKAYPQAKIHGTVRPKESRDNVQDIQTPFQLHELDITDAPSVYNLIDSIRPTIIFHLAAQSYVRTSWESPQSTIATNMIGEVNLLEAARLLKDNKYNPTIVITCSSEEYGLVPEKDLPITENTPLAPLSPYAVSKIGQDFLGFQYYKTYGLNTVRLRVFNHTGPKRPTAFGDSHVAHQVALIEAGLKEPVITYRNLDAIRDYSDVRDVVHAYTMAARYCKPGEVYNVCSGQGTSIKKIYDTLLSLSNHKKITLKADPAGPRPTDGGKIIGSNKKFVTKTGWQPAIDFVKQTLPDILEYWRHEINV
ncbi:MAG: GDP-mannose 4,6-dehydratase [Candidatus Andersenbacteria bacterium]|nr:GDP-mannose 4,6-dehydratase [Candidatus Andersenbacteria bacterium]